jgi:hypothetical protein
MLGSLAASLGSIGSIAGSIGSIGSALGSFGAFGSSKSAARKANADYMDMSRQLTIDGPKWQVEGLKSAGLNPVLAASGSLGGNPASASMAAMPTMENPAQGMANTALQAARLNEEVKNIRADTRAKQATADLNDNLGANARQQYKVLGAQASSAKSKAVQDKIEENWAKSRAGRFYLAIDKQLRSLNPFAEATAKKF